LYTAGLFVAFVFSSAVDIHGQDKATLLIQAIHKAAYEYNIAIATDDLNSIVTRLAARRYLGLFNLVCEETPDSVLKAAKSKLHGKDPCLSYILTAFARDSPPSRSELEHSAKVESEGRIALMTDDRAYIETKQGPLPLAYEDGAWKVDLTDKMKKVFLQLPLKPGGRQKIEGYR